MDCGIRVENIELRVPSGTFIEGGTCHCCAHDGAVEQDAANLFFQLVSSRYEHASLILTSNMPFARWGDVFSDQVVAAAMIDRIVHHAEVITLKGSSYRLRNTEIETLPSVRAENAAN